MATSLILIRVAPTGVEVMPRDIDGIEREVPVYPPSRRGQYLELLRYRLDLTTASAAAALGVSIEELRNLERGAAVLDSNEAWDRAEQALRDAVVDVMR